MNIFPKNILNWVTSTFTSCINVVIEIVKNYLFNFKNVLKYHKVKCFSSKIKEPCKSIFRFLFILPFVCIIRYPVENLNTNYKFKFKYIFIILNFTKITIFFIFVTN